MFLARGWNLVDVYVQKQILGRNLITYTEQKFWELWSEFPNLSFKLCPNKTISGFSQCLCNNNRHINKIREKSLTVPQISVVRLFIIDFYNSSCLNLSTSHHKVLSTYKYTEHIHLDSLAEAIKHMNQLRHWRKLLNVLKEHGTIFILR